ncbi:uncharacterized protein LOC121865425 isoform X2 [Homarus americanus]|uniref:uncharacterized protein LOC121865425 isoform X2 n=1 Tax=Homarus americanus TaxID=6706 RepID=UPI001C44E8BC|nr:uncharacterized protein LOC121865425 isoform X2 [Homarus americanus]
MGRERSYYTVGLCLAVLAIVTTGGEAAGYYGVRMGSLVPLQHQVKGEIYAVDSRTIHIRGFSYDGSAPDAFFYGGTSGRPSDRGFIIPDENGGTDPLGRYSNQDVTLTLPEGKTLKDLKWLSVWCRAFAIDFGHVMVNSNLNYPRPQKIDALPSLEHGVSSDRIVVVDAQTFLIPNFSYDGTAPDGHFWVGKGSTPGPSGQVVPDENGSEEPLKLYSGKTIVITLPGDLTVFDIDFLGVWCRAFLADFGHVRIPRNLNVPPSLKMLGVAPQTKLNCEVLWDDLALEVRWAVAGESIVMQLVGRITDGQYMAFGTSGELTRSVMIGGDVVVAWLDQLTGRGVAEDYYMSAKAQCQGGQGACPDNKITGSSNNVRLLNAALINDFTMLTFQRPLRSVDFSDAPILTNGSQAVIWAVGPVNSQGDTSYHTLRLRGDMFVDFGRTPQWNCPLPEDQNSQSKTSTSRGPTNPAPARPAANPWFIPPIPCYEPEDGVLYAQIGPTGGDNGYNAITGHVGWGISWYINGLLIPEINVVRGKTYTFVVEGGFDPERPSRYHPFYITDDPEGGYEFKTPAEQSRVRVFAGVGQDRDGSPVPTAYGRLCEWNEDPNQPANAFSSFGAYQRTLQLDCQEGQPGILQWTPDAATPDTVYYQCYTHRFLGWKIHVVDRCDSEQLTAAGSVKDSSVVLPGASDYDFYDYYYDERDAGAAPHPGFHRPPIGHTSNRIPGGGVVKPPRPTVTRQPRPQPKPADEILPGDFSFPNFPKEFQAGFDSFPFDLGPEDIGPVGQEALPPPLLQGVSYSPQNIPLGAPGFTFPKLPNLKNPASVVNATAFANLGNVNLRGVPRDVPKEFFGPQQGDLEFPKLSQDDMNFPLDLLREKFPSSPGPTRPATRPTFSSIPSKPLFTPPPKFNFPPELTRSSRPPTSSNATSQFFAGSATPPRTSTTIVSEKAPLNPKEDVRDTFPAQPSMFTKTVASYQPPPTRSSTPARHPLHNPPTTPSRKQTSYRPTPTSQPTSYRRTPTSELTSYRPTSSEISKSYRPTTTDQAASYRPTPTGQQTSYKPTPTRQPISANPTSPFKQSSFTRLQTPITPIVPSRHVGTSRPLVQTSHQQSRHEPEVITASSLPRLPGQASPVYQLSSLSRQHPIRRGLVTTSAPARTTLSPITTLSESFAQNFGFDPESVVYESDFRPIKRNPAGPVLAFEVSTSDIMPIRAPRPPYPPRLSFPQRPAGPRTAGPVRFSHRRIRFDDTDESHDKDSRNIPEEYIFNIPNPVFHDSVTFSESLDPPPIPLPVPMEHVMLRLGGAASNRPLRPNTPKPRPFNRKTNSSQRRNGSRRPNGPVRSSGSVNRMGWPKQRPWVHKPSLRRVAATVPLPDDHAIPFPQLVGPEVLKPVLVNSPLEHDDEDMVVAASAQVFTSDGRPLSPDSLPTPPRLPTDNRRSAASITNRPKTGPFRGDHPPPVPANVPHLAQFSRQQRPLDRRPTTPVPPPQGNQTPGIIASGSAIRPVVLHSQDDPPVPAALLTHQELSADVGHNAVVSISNYPATAEAYAPSRPPTTSRPDTAASSAATNQTHLTILKDVWAILTRDDPGLRPEHPRDDAHPDHDHDHLDRQERRRRDASEKPYPSTNSDQHDPMSASSVSTISSLILVSCTGALILMALAR